jgi:hypothetical protein
MRGKKYKIYQNSQFLGHHGGLSPAQAIEKMSKTLYPVAYNVNFNDYFDVYYGSDYSQIYVGEA